MPTATRGVEKRWYELRDIDVPKDLSTIRILAVPYDTWTNLGGYYERHARHSLDKSIKEAAKGLPLHLFHNTNQHAIGTSSKWVLNDPAGLIGEWRLDAADDRAMEAARKAADGFLNGASIGFQPLRSERVWNDEDDWDDGISREDAWMQVTRTESRLLEVSLTTVPAFLDAGVEWVRTFEPLTRDGAPAPARPGMSAADRQIMAEARATPAAIARALQIRDAG